MRLLAACLLIGTPCFAQQPDSAGRVPKPQFASGVIWVEPLPMSPRQLASLLTGTPEQELADSAVAALTQHFLQALAAERARAAAENSRPDWTTTIAGQPVGLDERWIYLGPIKLPSALLALLPLDVMANPTEMAIARRRNAMREDILTAGWRSANLAEFQDVVRRLRAEREAERQFEINRRTPPEDPGAPE